MESINTPKLDSHYYRFIGDNLFHNVTQFWCCFMSDDRVRLRLHPKTYEAMTFVRLHVMWKYLFLLYLCFLEILYRRCVLAPLSYNNENTDCRSTCSSNIFRPCPKWHPEPSLSSSESVRLRLSFTLLRRFQGRKRRLLKTLQTPF